MRAHECEEFHFVTTILFSKQICVALESLSLVGELREFHAAGAKGLNYAAAYRRIFGVSAEGESDGPVFPPLSAEKKHYYTSNRYAASELQSGRKEEMDVN